MGVLLSFSNRAELEPASATHLDQPAFTRAYTRCVPIEVALADGTKLLLTNPNVGPDEVLEKLDRITSQGQSAYINVESTDGTFRVNAHQIVYVRDVLDTNGSERRS